MEKHQKIELIRGQKYLVKGDILLFAALVLLVVIITVIAIASFKKDGAYANIYLNGELVRVMPLDTDGVFYCESEGGFNEIEVKDKKVFVKSADCPDKVCLATGSIGKNGETIICLPHRLRVVIGVKAGEVVL